jgi:hypothetical protein
MRALRPICRLLRTSLDALCSRKIGPYIGIIATMTIAANWLRLVPAALARDRKISAGMPAASAQTEPQRKLLLNLLFAFFWVLSISNSREKAQGTQEN